MVIRPELWTDWLDPGNSDTSDLLGLLAPAGSGGLISYPVSTAVNSVRNNGPLLIERAEPGAAEHGSAGSPAEPPARSPRLPSAASRGASISSRDTLF